MRLKIKRFPDGTEEGGGAAPEIVEEAPVQNVDDIYSEEVDDATDYPSTEELDDFFGRSPKPAEPAKEETEAPVQQESPADPAGSSVPEQSVVQPDEMTSLRQQNAALLQQLNQMATAVQALHGQQPAAQTQPVAQQQAVQKFVESDDDMEWTPENLNKVLTAVYDRAVAAAQESVFRTIPQFVNKVVNDQLTVTTTVKEFFDNNKDFLPIRPYVEMEGARLQAAHPEWSADTLFTELAKTVRSTLQASQAQAGAPAAQAATNRPAFAGRSVATNGSVVKPELTREQREIQDMLDFSERNRYIPRVKR